MQTLRFLVFAFAMLGLTAALGPVGAQAPPTGTPPATTGTPPPAGTASSDLDLTLLKRAFSPLASEGLLQSQSALEMSGSKAGISFTFHERVDVVAKRPGKFRADVVQVSADGAPQRKLTLVSDGAKVWTYSPTTHQYSVTTAKAFHAANNEVTAMGLAVSGFFLGDGHQMSQGLNGVTAENSAQVLTVLAGLDITLSKQAESLNGEDDIVYRMMLKKQGLAYRFIIAPDTAALRQVELAGQMNGINITFREAITQLKPLGSVTPQTFQFTPPPGTAKVASLSVDPL